MNEKLKLSCFINNSLDSYQYHFFIYDLRDNLIFDKFINQDNFVYFIPPYCGVYKIKIVIFQRIPQFVYQGAFFYKKNYDRLSFYFNYSSFSPIVIKLTDQYYKGLEIKKGEIKLWQNHM